MLPRVLEPELMDTAEDAREYDAMDHAAVNAQFVTDLLNAIAGWSHSNVGRTILSDQPRGTDRNVRPTDQISILDLGAGTAQIPIELARRAHDVHITAIDAAETMLDVARKNVAAARLFDRICLILADAKQLPFASGSFPIVISNSIVHHVAEPQTVLSEAIRVTSRGGFLFHRDLARPTNETQLQHLVETYAGNASLHQRKLFAESLRAALTVQEVRDLVAKFGFDSGSVQMTSDRHWTWSVLNN